MSENKAGSLLTNTAIAVFAGAMGSVLTLGATGALSVAEPPESGALTVNASNEQTVILDDVATLDEKPTLPEVRKMLAEATEERSQLVDSMLSISRTVETLEAKIIVLESDNQALAVSDLNSPEAPPESTSNTNSETNTGNRPNRRLGEEQRVESLIAAGVDEQTARDLQSRGDQYQLARLELFDQASREGWAESDQLNERLDALESNRPDLREELGDDAYDRYLYESGNSNRVSIGSIITGSAADISGLQASDQIISYAGLRVFQVQELQEATRAGARGENVQLEIDRGGQAISANVPRGPLGVTLNTTRTQP